MPDTQQQLIYIANARMPTEKAHGIQIAHMCEALGRTMSVTLVLPERANTIQEDLCSFYQIERTFSVRLIRCIDLLEQKWVPKRLAYWLEAITFSIHVAKYIRSLPSHSLLYTRDLFSLVLVSPRRPVVYEIHSLPKKHTRFFGWLLQKTARIVAISHGLERELVARGYPADRIVVAPDAVDVQDFTVDTTQQSCRKKIHLPEGKKIAMYTGHGRELSNCCFQIFVFLDLKQSVIQHFRVLSKVILVLLVKRALTHNSTFSPKFSRTILASFIAASI